MSRFKKEKMKEESSNEREGSKSGVLDLTGCQQVVEKPRVMRA